MEGNLSYIDTELNNFLHAAGYFWYFVDVDVFGASDVHHCGLVCGQVHGETKIKLLSVPERGRQSSVGFLWGWVGRREKGGW